MHAGEMHTPLFSYASTHAEQHGIDALLGSLRAGLDAHEPEDPVAYLQGALQNMSSPKVIIAGAPASGKGTQCEYLVKTFGFVHISTGDLLRQEVKDKTPLGQQAEELMGEGKLVPDALVVELLVKRLERDDVRQGGWLLDGFPRTVSQLQAMQARDLVADAVVLLEVSDATVIARVEGRRTDPTTGKVYHLTNRPPPQDIVGRLVQRADDTREKIAERLIAYHSHIDPLIKNFTAPVFKVHGDGKGPREIMHEITAPLQKMRWAKLRAALTRSTTPTAPQTPQRSSL